MAVVDNRQTLAKRVGLFHVMSGQQHGLPCLVIFANDFPQQDARLGIEAGAGFVEKQDLRIVHHGAGNGEPLHHAAGKSAHHLIGTFREFEFFKQGVGALISQLGSKSKVGAVEDEDLAGGQREIEVGTLRDDADQDA